MKVKWTERMPPAMGEEDYVNIQLEGTVIGTVAGCLGAVFLVVLMDDGSIRKVNSGKVRVTEK